ncbi:MAG: 4Fe-4S binding protein [Anaerolineae bacterium]|nr:4Fe-4S binding protein [Anaerolineae bacterium]
MERRPRPRLLRPSTRAFIQEARRTRGYSLFDWLHGYVYARWPYLYIGIATDEHPLARAFKPLVRFLARLFPSKANEGQNPDRVTFADTYHGKVVPLEAATRLVTVQQEITLTDLEQVIPYAKARDIVLRNPDHIVVLECPCRASRPNPCQPLDVCLVIGEPFASFVAEHHPRRSRWITQEEAVEILRAEHERGHVHHAFFKDAMLGRFYAICNCCSCCCGAMQAWQHGTPMLAPSGYVSRVDAELCIGCSTCVAFCQFGALSMNDSTAVVDATLCMGCGVCVSKCEQGALSLARDPNKGEPLEIRELMTRALGGEEI